MKILNLIVFLFYAKSLIAANPQIANPQLLCEFQRPPSDASEEQLEEALNYLRNECLPLVKKVYECTYRVDAILAEFKGYIDRFFNDPSERPLVVENYNYGEDTQERNLDVYRNFAFLRSKQNEGTALIQEFINKYVGSSSTGLDINDEIKALDADYISLSNTLVQLSESESVYLYILSITLRQFERSFELQKDDISWIYSMNCTNASLGLVLDHMDEVSRNMITQMNQVKKYILEVRKSRFNLVQHAYKSLREVLSNKLSEYYITELSELREKVHVILRVNDIAHAYHNWWANTYNDWERNNLYQVYLQYEKPLALYKMDVYQAYKYKKQIELVSVDYPEVGASYLDYLVNRIIPVTENRVSRLETKGWSGVLERQQLLAQARLDDDRYSEVCKQYMGNYLVQASKVSILADFRVIELIYRDGVEKCRS